MDAILNQARRAAQEAMNDRPNTRIGIVDGYDPARQLVRVRVQPEDVLTDWIPLKAAAVGNGWGMVFGPSIGDALDIEFTSGTPDGASAGLRYFNDRDQPPAAPSGECWIVHKSGASVKLLNGGDIALDTGAGASIVLQGGNITSAGTWAHTGDATFTGNINLGGTGGQGVARIGDTVSGGVITGGSTKVKST